MVARWCVEYYYKGATDWLVMIIRFVWLGYVILRDKD